MFNTLNEKTYLRERQRQEKFAEQCPLENADNKTRLRFLSKEERLQTYEFMNIEMKKNDVVLFFDIDEDLFYQLCVMARRHRTTYNEHIKTILQESVQSN